MKLQGRNLEPNMRDDDVKELQAGLRELGFEGVNQNGFFDSTTFTAVQTVQRQHALPVTGVVDAKTVRVINAALNAQPREAYVVQGSVVHSDGRPVVQATVTLMEKRLRKEPVLGEARTDALGRFEIKYPIPATLPLSILLRARDRQGRELAISDLICDAKPVETVTLVAAGEALRGPSEFTIIDAEVTPLLKAENVKVSDLTQEDLKLIACRKGLDPELLKHYADAGKLAEQSGLVAAALYGLFRQNVPVRMAAILQERPEVLRSILQRASDQDQIPATLIGQLNPFFRRLRALQIQQTFAKPEAKGASSLSDLLSTARISREQQTQIMTRYVEHKGEAEEFWDELRKDGTIGGPSIDRAQFALQLGALTKNHVPLVRTLMQRHRPTSTRDLVSLSRQDWLNLIRGRGGAGVPPGIPGARQAEREENYAEVITATLEESFPTSFLAARLVGETDSAFPGQAEVVQFLDRNPDFAFERVPVDRYLEERGEAALEGIVEPETLRANLRGIARLAPLAGPVRRHEVIQPLLREGLTSALAI